MLPCSLVATRKNVVPKTSAPYVLQLGTVDMHVPNYATQ